MTDRMDDPHWAARLELHARRLLAHGLEQRRHGTEGLGAAIDAVLDEAEDDIGPDDVFARALGLVFTDLPEASAAELADTARAGIPPLLGWLDRTDPPSPGGAE